MGQEWNSNNNYKCYSNQYRLKILYIGNTLLQNYEKQTVENIMHFVVTQPDK
jgi:hypothetical protein